MKLAIILDDGSVEQVSNLLNGNHIEDWDLTRPAVASGVIQGIQATLKRIKMRERIAELEAGAEPQTLEEAQAVEAMRLNRQAAEGARRAILAEEEGEAHVAPEDACPACGEDRTDCLVWDDDGASVQCQTCSKTYSLAKNA